MVLTREYRHPVQKYMTSLPAGGVHPGESLLESAQRELEEETGFLAEDFREIGALFSKNWEVVKLVWWMLGTKRRIERDPNRFAYMDQALTPVNDEEDEKTFDYLTKTAGAQAAIEHLKKVHALTHASVAAE